ncbi:MAG: hypothetical protein ABIZ04_24805 [Opitutus sp.]
MKTKLIASLLLFSCVTAFAAPTASQKPDKPAKTKKHVQGSDRRDSDSPRNEKSTTESPRNEKSTTDSPRNDRSTTESPKDSHATTDSPRSEKSKK